MSYITFSNDLKKILGCLRNKRAITILNYNLLNNNIKLSEEKISFVPEDRFKKCIYIDNYTLIAMDYKSIYLLNKNNSNSNEFVKTKELNLNNELYDICLVNEKYLLFSQRTKITFLNIKMFNEEKVLKGIICSEKVDNLI